MIPAATGIKHPIVPCPPNELILRALAEGKRVVLVFRGKVDLCAPFNTWQPLRLQEDRNVFAYLSPL